MNGYQLSRNWFDFCFINPEKIKPIHTALYEYSIELCNRLGWKEKFGLPTSVTMEVLGVKSYNTYKKTLDDLVKWNFIKMIERSKNQYSANIIALSNFNKAYDKAEDNATDKAHDKALIKHTTKQDESTQQSIVSIIKQLTNKQLTKKEALSLKNAIDVFFEKDEKKSPPPFSLIFDHWNDKEIIQHKEIRPEIKEQINRSLKKYSHSQIITGIDNYSTVLNAPHYRWSHKWSLIDFLSRKNGISTFLEDGTNWVNYCDSLKKNLIDNATTQTTETSQERLRRQYARTT